MEIVLLILSFLKQSDLATCMLVCRRIYWIGAHRCLCEHFLTVKVYVNVYKTAGKSVSITKKTTSDEMMTNISWKRPQCLKLVHSVGRISNSVLQRSFMRMASLQVCMYVEWNPSYGHINGPEESMGLKCKSIFEVLV